ncbi:hypothetical protein BC831DRAFT_467349 [Entophlyctis helioformis]|nr:hypothetical protein BC831DRAFT_467349 [Entophlyctis helioformis]
MCPCSPIACHHTDAQGIRIMPSQTAHHRHLQHPPVHPARPVGHSALHRHHQHSPAYAIGIHATPVSAILSRHALVSIHESHTALRQSATLCRAASRLHPSSMSPGRLWPPSRPRTCAVLACRSRSASPRRSRASWPICRVLCSSFSRRRSPRDSHPRR